MDDVVKSRGTNFFRDGTAATETQESENFMYLEEGDHKGITSTKKQLLTTELLLFLQVVILSIQNKTQTS